MMRKWLSRYRVRYPRSLVYMLQASEYSASDFLVWCHRAKDFTNVEYRKQLVKTGKARYLITLGWMFIVLSLIAAVWFAWLGEYVVSLAIVLVMPYGLVYVLIFFVFVSKTVLQHPIEHMRMRQTQEILAAHKAIKIGIAGSFGKTTVREILKTVLSEGKKVAAPPHSYNTPLGISEFVKTLTGDEDVLIFEFGEYYPGDVQLLCDLVQPDMGVIAGVNEAHLEKFKTLERTVGTIYELADFLGEKLVYVNGENELARKNARQGHIVYDRNHTDGWEIKDHTTSLMGTSFTMVKGGVQLVLRSSLLGLHHVGPLAAAVDLALRLGLSHDEVKAGISKTKPFDHRLSPSIDNSGVTMLDDSYNGNPDGVKAVIEFLASLKDCRRWYVTPGLVEMGSQTREVHRQIGHLLARAHIEKVVLVKNSVTSFIEEGLKEEVYTGDVLWFDDALAAFAALPNMTVKGDVVLLQNDWPDQYQ